jgi:hypothetical protein
MRTGTVALKMAPGGATSILARANDQFGVTTTPLSGE